MEIIIKGKQGEGKSVLAEYIAVALHTYLGVRDTKIDGEHPGGTFSREQFTLLREGLLKYNGVKITTEQEL